MTERDILMALLAQEVLMGVPFELTTIYKNMEEKEGRDEISVRPD